MRDLNFKFDFLLIPEKLSCRSRHSLVKLKNDPLDPVIRTLIKDGAMSGGSRSHHDILFLLVPRNIINRESTRLPAV